MPAYDTLSESEYDGLSEAEYNALVEIILTTLMFRSGLLIFCSGGRLWFGPDCPGSCIPSTPSCIALRRFDFLVCGGCATGADCGATPLWDGVLHFDGTQWSIPLSCTPGGRKVSATVTVSGSTYTLTVLCDTGSTVWQGTHSGSNPTGTYARSSGCDTTPLMFMF